MVILHLLEKSNYSVQFSLWALFPQHHRYSKRATSFLRLMLSWGVIFEDPCWLVFGLLRPPLQDEEWESTQCHQRALSRGQELFPCPWYIQSAGTLSKDSSSVPHGSRRLCCCCLAPGAVRTGQGMLTRPLLLWCSCPARSSEQLLSCSLVPSDFEHHWNHCPISSSKQESSRVPKCRIPFKIWLDWLNVSGIFKISYLKGNPFWFPNFIMDQNHICLIPGDLCWEERL